MTERNPLELLNQLEDILDSDSLIDEVGFIHPSQFVTLNEEAGALPLSIGNILQSEDGVLRSCAPKVNSSQIVFWCRDHKLGISSQVLFPLYNAAKHAFMAALGRYKTHCSISVKKDESGGNAMPSCILFSLDSLEGEVLKHSRALLLLSCDFGTAWNARKLILSNKQDFQMFVDELFFSALVLSYAPKSEGCWSHRRWVIKMIAGKFSNLQEILEKESELVERVAEKSKMNYRAWNHRCWLVSFMSERQVLHELNKSRDWTRLHVADSSCFHYRSRLMLRMLEESWHNQIPTASSSHYAELRRLCKEELDWNKMLIKHYIGREALWLHRRFLSLVWIKHFATDICDVSSNTDCKDGTSHEIGIYMDDELGLFRSCSTIPDNDFEDFQAQATLSATYILWLTKQITETLGINLQIQLLVGGEMKTVMEKVCPEKIPLWQSFWGICEEAYSHCEEN